MSSNDGDRYEGDFKNDKKEGKGIFYWKDGTRYEGDFKNGFREGLGVMHFKNGMVKKCRWEKDTPVDLLNY